MSSVNLATIAQSLHQAMRQRQPIFSQQEQQPFNLKQAYQIQELGIQLRLNEGERLTGVKLGFTSKAKMQQMGVNHLIFGSLTNAMSVNDSDNIQLTNFIHPRIEPEIAFITKKEISRPISMAEVFSYIDGVAPALEIIDSRYQQFKFSLEDVVADNCSSAGYLIGAMQSAKTDVCNCGVQLRINGRLAEAGSTAAILGSPLRTIVAISEQLHLLQIRLAAGSIILAGAATAAVALQPKQQVSCIIEGLGSLQLSIS